MKRYIRLSRDERGFTLIEMLVVMAIIGILLTTAAPKVIGALGKAREKKAETNIALIQSALEQFKEDYGQYPVNLYVLKYKGYVKNSFNFKNGYNAIYFYAVDYDEDIDRNFTKYVLADPGKEPADDPTNLLVNIRTSPPEGGKVDPLIGNAAASAYYWGTNEVGDDLAITQDFDLNSDGDVTDPREFTVTVAAIATFNVTGDGTSTTRPAFGTYDGTVVQED